MKQLSKPPQDRVSARIPNAEQQTVKNEPFSLPSDGSPCHPREAFLLEMMKENLNQARHVENERMMFVTLFAALVGVVLAIVIEFDNQLLSVVTLITLMLLNFVSLSLTCRWNTVFSCHWSLAQRISCYLLEYDPAKENNRRCGDIDDDYLENFSHNNPFFRFQNKKRRFYLRTAWLFTGFNICILILLGVALVHVLSPHAIPALFQ